MADILQRSDAQVLSRLLEKSGRCHNLGGRTALLEEIGRDVNFLGSTIENMVPRDFAIQLVSRLNTIGDHKALLTILEIIQDAGLPNVSAQIGRLKAALQTQQIHIITGAKGGIGKTLVSLSIASYYLDMRNGKSLVTIDMNSTNQDLSRILSWFKKEDELETIPEAPSWQRGTIETLHLVRPDDPYFIKGGATSFWANLNEVVNISEYVGGAFDILVDTNMHLSNLTKPRQDLSRLTDEARQHLPEDLREDMSDIIDKLLAVSGRKIYLWIFWTWASFYEIEPIMDALNLLERNFGSRMTAIHVLNPSALMSPKIATPPTLDDYRSRIERWNKDINEIQAKTDEDAEIQQMQISNLESNIQLLWETIERLPKHIPHAVPGLSQLSTAPVVEELSTATFIQEVAEIFKRVSGDDRSAAPFQKLNEHIVGQFGGRPRNLIPISTHSPALIGYTETFARNRPSQIKDLKDTVETITEDMRKYLPELAYL